jgi:hypothetical protein
MMENEKLQKWKETEAFLASILDDLRDKFEVSDVSLIENFLDNREYEVALHWMISVICDRKIEIGEETLIRMRLAADMTGADATALMPR